MLGNPNAGEKVRIAREKASQFQPQARERDGVIVRVRRDGLAVVRWEGLSSEQIFAPALLERIEQ